MSVLKSILSESNEYYLNIKGKIEKKLADLSAGSVKERKIFGGKYYYLQYRRGKKIIHKYLGRKKPLEILKQIHERKKLKAELKKVNQSLKLLKRAQGQKRD